MKFSIANIIEEYCNISIQNFGLTPYDAITYSLIHTLNVYSCVYSIYTQKNGVDSVFSDDAFFDPVILEQRIERARRCIIRFDSAIATANFACCLVSYSVL